MTDETELNEVIQLGSQILVLSGVKLGVCVLVRGAVVAWFADFDDATEAWCTENHFGEWLTWRAAAPVPIPLTAAEQADCDKRAAALRAKMRIE